MKFFTLLFGFTIITIQMNAQIFKKSYYIQNTKASMIAISAGSQYKIYNTDKQGYLSNIAYDTIHGHYDFSGTSNSVIVVGMNGQFGLVDAVTGHEIISPGTSLVTHFTDKLYFPTNPFIWETNEKQESLTSIPLFVDAYWGYHYPLNPVLYYYTRNCSTYELENMKVGYHDQHGHEIIKPQYEKGTHFFGDMAFVAKGEKFGGIDSANNVVIPFKYDKFDESRFKYDLWPAIIKKDGAWGLVSKNGEELSAFRYTEIYAADEHTFIVKIDSSNHNLYGLIHKNGKEITPVEYDFISKNSQDKYYTVWKNEKSGLLDDNGNLTIPVLYDDILVSSVDADIILAKQNDKWGMLNSKNQLLIKPDQFDALITDRSAIDNKVYYFAAINNKWGYINKKGKFLLKPTYESIEMSATEKGVAFLVFQNNQWMKIDKKGKVLATYDRHPDIIIEIEIQPDFFE